MKRLFIVCSLLVMAALVAFAEQETSDGLSMIAPATPSFPTGSLDQGSDSCAGAPVITALPYCDEGTTWWYQNNYNPTCAPSGGRDVVYRLRLTTATTATVSLCGSYFNTVLSIYRNACPSAGGLLVCCNDDFACGAGPNPFTSCCPNIAFLANTNYFIVVDGFDANAAGHYILHVQQSSTFCPSEHCTGTPPPNDLCGALIGLPNPNIAAQWVQGWTVGATIDATPVCNTISQVAPGVWYSIIGNGQTITMTTCDPYTDFDTEISVFCNACDNLLCVTANDNFNIPVCGMTSEVSWCSENGREYFILIHGGAAWEVGKFRLGYWTDGLNCANPPVCTIVPPNDLCQNAQILPTPSTSGYSVLGTTVAATWDQAPCCVNANTAPGVWYQLAGSGNTVTASLCNIYTAGHGWAPKLSIYCGDCSNLICVDGNANYPDCAWPNLPQVSWCSEPGRMYYILVHGVGNAVGSFSMDVWDDGIVCSPWPVCDRLLPPLNDFCDNATLLTAAGFPPQHIFGSTIGATLDNAPFCDVADVAPGVWYKIMGTGNPITVTTCNEYTQCTGYDSRISVYCNTCQDPICVMGNDNFNIPVCGLTSEVTWCADIGRNYYILVHGAANTTGLFQLDWWADTQSCTPAPCAMTGDSCEDAIVINQIPYCTEGTTYWYTDNYQPSCGPLGGKDRVYRYSPYQTEVVNVSLCGSYFDTVLHIWMECPSRGGIEICCDDNSCGTGSLQSCCRNVVMNAGMTYYIVVDGAGPAAAGHYILHITPSTAQDCLLAHCPGVLPPNDSCTAAIPLPNPNLNAHWVTGWTIGATLDNAPLCNGEAQIAPGVWYSIVGNGHTITLTTCDNYTDFDTKLSVFCHACNNPVCVTANDNYSIPLCGYTSRVSWCSEPQQIYYILVHGGSAIEVGNFHLFYWDDGVACSPYPSCEPAGPDTMITYECCYGPVNLVGSTVNAGNDCNTRPSNDQIWEIHLPFACQYKFDMCASPAWNSYLYLDTACCAATHLASNDDGCDTGGGLSLIDCIYLSAGTYYLLVEGNTASDSGAYVIQISCCCHVPPTDAVDLGDLARCNYPTLPGNPAHELSGIAWLGSTVTPEPLPRILNMDIGDDGVTMPAWPWPPVPVPITVTVTPGPNYFHYLQECCGCLWLNGWMDVNNDGDFCDNFGSSSEWIIQDVLVNPGPHNFVVSAHVQNPELGPCGIFRYRLTSQPVGRYGFGKVDPAQCPNMVCGTFDRDFLGEVEDYLLAGKPYNLVIWPLVGFEHTHIRLNWQAAPCALTYWIYRDTTSEFTPSLSTVIASTNSLSYIDTVVTTFPIQLPRYFYQVTASNP